MNINEIITIILTIIGLIINGIIAIIMYKNKRISQDVQELIKEYKTKQVYINKQNEDMNNFLKDNIKIIKK